MRTISGALRAAALQYGAAPALVDVDGEARYTWRQADARCDGLAARLWAEGVRPGCHVGLWAFDRCETALCFFALNRIGAVPVWLGTRLTPAEAGAALHTTGTGWLLVGEGDRAQQPDKASVLLGASGEPRAWYIGEKPRSRHRYLTPLDAAPPQVERAEADTGAILFTSGTTGGAKAVRLAQGAMLQNAADLAKGMGLRQSDVVCQALPMFHCFGLMSGLLACVQTGASLVFPKRRHAAHILAAVNKQGCTVLHAVPTLYLSLVRHKAFARYNTASLRLGIIGGAACGLAQMQEIADTLPGFTLLPSLGQTEATAGITLAPPGAPWWQVGAGPLLPGIEGRIDQPGADGAGELCIRGYSVMQGYHGGGASPVDLEGWLHTGDVGHFDKAGNFHMTGRLKDIIIRGGENICPAELEALFLEDARIAAARCVGVPDPHFGEQVCACLVAAEGKAITGEEARALLAGRLADYKIPRYVLFLPALPQTASGKVKTDALRRKAVGLLRKKGELP